MPRAPRRDGRRRASRSAREPDAATVTALLAQDLTFSGSITCSVGAAWENARGAREAISSELWETLNTTYREVGSRARAGTGPAQHDFFGWVRDRAAACNGIVDSTMSRDDGWRFLVRRPQPRARRHDRRGCCARATATPSAAPAGRRRCAAARPTRRTCARTSTRSTPSSAVEFLLLDRLFPRSVFHALHDRRAAASASSTRARRVPASTTRPAGSSAASCAELEFLRVDEAIDDLPKLLARLQHECARRARGDRAAVLPRDPRRSSGASDRCRGACGSSTPRRYQYSADVHASYNEARISPLDTPNQFTLEHRVDVHPAANLFRYRDYWGSRVHAFDLHQPHTELTVVGSSLVETAERTPNLDDTVAWDAIDAPGPHRPVLRVPQPTPTMTESDDAIRQVGARSCGEAPTPGGGAVASSASGCASTSSTRPAPRACRRPRSRCCAPGAGVCQDFAHLGIAVLRAAGIPARYASGYLYPDELGGVVGEMHQGESHAWLEAWVGDWHPLDPTSGSAVAERHVLVARGRDYADVAPLKGVYHGGPSHSLAVDGGADTRRVTAIGVASTATGRFRGRRVVSPHVSPEPQCHGDHHGQRRPDRARRRAADAARAVPPRGRGPHRHQRRLRHVVVRRVHGAARRRVGEVVHDARRPGRRRGGHHDRGPRRRRRAAPDAGRRSTSTTGCSAGTARRAW